MKFHWTRKRVIISALLAGAMAMGASSKRIVEAVKAMERERGLTVVDAVDLAESLRLSQRTPKFLTPMSRTLPPSVPNSA